MSAARQLAFDVTGDSRGAIFSDCRRWRYRLWRRWGSGPHVLWVLANPSTADEDLDDPTMRRCQSYARRWGYDGIEVVNIFAWRSTDPRGLKGLADPVGPDNDTHIREAAASASLVMAAWGVGTGAEWFLARATLVRAMLSGRELMCLGRTRRGEPRHPLYVSAATKPRAL